MRSYEFWLDYRHDIIPVMLAIRFSKDWKTLTPWSFAGVTSPYFHASKQVEGYGVLRTILIGPLCLSACWEKGKDDLVLPEFTSCSVCGAEVDMRETDDGGSPDGCELENGHWVCSGECWDAHAETKISMRHNQELHDEIITPDDLEKTVQEIVQRSNLKASLQPEAVRRAMSRYLEPEGIDKKPW